MIWQATQPFIIAEAGVNHNGSIGMALQLVDAATQAGVDAIKFQTFRAAELVTRSTAKADYQKEYTEASESQFEMLRKLELSERDHIQLAGYCRTKELLFLSTAFDMNCLKFLINTIDVPLLKIGSGEVTNGPFLLAHAQSGKKIILSTGMATLDEISNALAVLAHGYVGGVQCGPEHFRRSLESEDGRDCLRKNVTLLHCTTEYPVEQEVVNLQAMKTLSENFGLKVGFSDHSRGIMASVIATALGATVIEKHFTLNKNLPGPDHQASLEPQELREMVQQIRDVGVLLGHGKKEPSAGENENRKAARRTLVAGTAIRPGDVFTERNLAIKRAGEGLSPMRYWDLLGKSSNRPYDMDEVIERI